MYSPEAFYTKMNFQSDQPMTEQSFARKAQNLPILDKKEDGYDPETIAFLHSPGFLTTNCVFQPESQLNTKQALLLKDF